MGIFRLNGFPWSEGLSRPKASGTGAALGLAARSDDTDDEGYSPSNFPQTSTSLRSEEPLSGPRSRFWAEANCRCTRKRRGRPQTAEWCADPVVVWVVGKIKPGLGPVGLLGTDEVMTAEGGPPRQPNSSGPPSEVARCRWLQPKEPRRSPAPNLSGSWRVLQAGCPVAPARQQATQRR